MSYEKDMAILDKHTTIYLEAYWNQTVTECQEANATGKTDSQETAPSGA